MVEINLPLNGLICQLEPGIHNFQPSQIVSSGL